MSDESPTSTTSPLPPAPPLSSAGNGWRNFWATLALLGLGLAGWQWLETRSRLADAQQEMARRLAEAEAASKETRNIARHTQEQANGMQTRLAALDARVSDSQGQTAALESLYQELARSKDDAILAEVEQGINLAAQQLQLAGNVQVAILALQSAENRLSRIDRPQFIALRKTLNRDLDRLRSTPYVDIPGMSLRLENLIISLDSLPLAVDERPRPADDVPAELAGSSAWWKQLGENLWLEVRNLIRIQRFDRSDPILLAPGQAFFLRENVKLRLLNARLALLSRDQWTFRNELKLCQEWLERHFDVREKPVQQAQSMLRQLSGTEIVIELPTLNDSLQALRNFRPVKEKR
ncbi:MAG: hypothetical protein RIR00_2154 [Pseudomonadota bacterium]|jgi:uroporphyrin-3 C-methyltransferase